MIRGLLITTVVSFLVAVVCLSGAAVLGGGVHWSGKTWSFDSGETCSWSADHRKKDCTFTGVSFGSRTSDGVSNEVWPSNPGPIATRDLDWDGDEALEISVPATIVYTQGPKAGISVTGPKNYIDLIKVDGINVTTGGRQRLPSKRGDVGIQITVQAPAVKAFRLNGAQTMTIKDFDQDSLQFEMNGAGRLAASGTARELKLRVNGAGQARMDDLVNEDAKIEINGASDVSAAPRTSVDIRINGVGKVTLLTRPANVKQTINGLGSVTFEGRDGPATKPAKGPPPNV